MRDEIEALKVRVGELQSRVDEAWPGRTTDPESLSSALTELNEAVMELNRLWEAQQR